MGNSDMDDFKIEHKKVMCPDCSHVFNFSTTISNSEYLRLSEENINLNAILRNMKNKLSSVYCYGFEEHMVRAESEQIKITELRDMCRKMAGDLEYYAKHNHHLNSTAPNFAKETLNEYYKFTKEIKFK